MGLELPVWDVPTAAWIVATLGLVGASVLDRFLDNGGSDDDDSGGMGGGDDPFGGGEMGGGGGMGGGGMGGGDDFDDFDGMDEWDDDFDDGGGGGSNTDELENRLDELENEVSSLSSTVSTVRSENEEISAAVDDIEEDVRNLLDIYEMVTRGINPFVDDSSGFGGVDGGGEGSFGLFDDDEEENAGDDDLDDDIANADADGFFDDDLLDDDFEDDDDDEFAELDEEPGDEHTDDGDPADAASETAVADDGDDMNDDGKSFSELKEEYDAGEADWADEDGAETDADTTADDDPFDDAGDSFDDGEDPFEEEIGDEPDPFDDGPADDAVESFDEGMDSFDEDPVDDGRATNGHEPEPEPEAKPEPEPEPEPQAKPEPEPEPERSRGQRPGGDPAEANAGGFEYVRKDDLSGTRGKPYLTELPGDYVGDLLVMEWLEFLVSESDVTDAVRAINYYERIEWVGPEAAARLRDFLSGFGTIDRNLVDRPGTDRLVREHHTRSLRYVTQLNGTSGHLLLLDRWDDLASGSLVGGGPPRAGSSRGGRGGYGRHEGSRDRRAPEQSDDRRDARPSENGRGGDAERRDSQAERHGERRDGHADPHGSEGRERNGGSPRPMNDPNPRSDRADPADGGWGDGR
ncbi:FlaD/FlaE family flagellar protein [Halorubrum sp. N11]|uniref:FlaD/FlaE family flagellar protein n=1 Tax=Halorubrum sp. N11 TaxID=3402276 RepID=UPI003EB7EF23